MCLSTCLLIGPVLEMQISLIMWCDMWPLQCLGAAQLQTVSRKWGKAIAMIHSHRNCYEVPSVQVYHCQRLPCNPWQFCLCWLLLCLSNVFSINIKPTEFCYGLEVCSCVWSGRHFNVFQQSVVCTLTGSQPVDAALVLILKGISSLKCVAFQKRRNGPDRE